MVKPAGPYLEVIAALVRAAVDLPVAAYRVSGLAAEVAEWLRA